MNIFKVPYPGRNSRNIAYLLRSVLSDSVSVYVLCVVLFFREICGQRVVFLAISCIFMPVWRVKCLMSLSGQLARCGFMHVVHTSLDLLSVFRGCWCAPVPRAFLTQVFSVAYPGIFIKIFCRGTTGIHGRAKQDFDLNFFVRKIFLWMLKPGGKNYPQSWSICAVPGRPLPSETLANLALSELGFRSSTRGQV